jgi:hypothetical protein
VPVQPYPVADAVEFLQGDAAAGAFGNSHDVLGDAVVDLCGVPLLSTSRALEPARRGLGAPGLQLSAFTCVPTPITPQPAALEVHEIAGGGQVGDATGRHRSSRPVRTAVSPESRR